MAKRIVNVPIEKLKATVYARRQLNEDRVMQFALMLEAGEQCDPITVTPDLEVIDGRHRLAARDQIDADPAAGAGGAHRRARSARWNHRGLGRKPR